MIYTVCTNICFGMKWLILTVNEKLIEKLKINLPRKSHTCKTQLAQGTNGHKIDKVDETWKVDQGQL